ncbi:hypothetical protein KC19_VG310700 [Ceratodon purpureus]|uniref:Uncharacterized protein n=1 Tax=Ceratodon purpureus TaxID=3225 RepID=A0A8T0HVD0_CERPU|nr:hypothetical protein KC19_VG310700 [Ceratodon purpureus]
MDELVESVRRLANAEIETLILRLEVRNLRSEINETDVLGLRDALTDAQETYESELDALANILQLFNPARRRRGLTDVERRVGRHLRDVINEKEEKEEATKRWWRGTRRVQSVQHQIRIAEEELANLEAVEQLTREDCYAPIVHLARVWTYAKAVGRKP